MGEKGGTSGKLLKVSFLQVLYRHFIATDVYTWKSEAKVDYLFSRHLCIRPNEIRYAACRQIGSKSYYAITPYSFGQPKSTIYRPGHRGCRSCRKDLKTQKWMFHNELS